MDMVQALCLAAIVAAVLFARWLNYGIFKGLTLPLVLFALAGIPDGLATAHFGHMHPEMEGNPLVRPFLANEFALALGFFIWVFGWLSITELAWRSGMHNSAMLIPLLLFIGHAWGLSTWLHLTSPQMLAEIAVLALITVGVLYFICVVGINEKAAKQQRG